MPRGAKRKPTTPPEDEKSSKKTKLNLLQCDPREEHFLLPDEIVLQIFQQLERSDILQCSIACRQWYRISQCDEFHWFYIVSFTLVEYASGYHYLRNEKLKTFADLTKEEQEKELQLWQKDSIHNEPPVRIESNTKDDTHWLYDEQDELVAIAKTDMGYSDSWVNFEFNSKKNASLWKYDVTEVTEQYAAAAKGTRHWKARVYINLKRLDEMVIEKNTKAIPNKEVLIDPIDYDWKKHTILQKVIEQGAANIVNTPMVFSGPIQSPQGLINNFTLSERQLEAASWMKSIEDKIGQEFSYTVAMKWKGSRVFFDIDKRNVVHPRDISKYTCIEKISGGILGSDTNRILSYEVIGLMLMSQAKLEPRPDLISSRATLIMCFFNDAKQWQEDIIRATRLNTILIADVEDMKHCTYEDFISKCDVIICTYEVLRSAKYLCLPNTRTKANISPEERNPKVQAALTELITKKNFTEVKTPILEHFFFNRVVFDKAHQAETLYRFQHWSLFLTRKIYGRCKWFISRDPFSVEAKNIIPRFFGIKHSSQFLYEYIYRNLMWRNSFTTELNEDLKDEVYLIDMTVIERAVSFYKPNETFPYCAKTYVEGLKAAAETYLKRMKFMQNQKEFGSSAIFQNASEILTEELARLETIDTNPKEQTDEEKAFATVQLQQGTKVAEMFRYLKQLFAEKPNSRVVVFSMEDPSEILLEHQNIERLLNEHGIMTTSVQDDTDDIEEFKKNIEPFKVILMNVRKHSPKTNAIGATHVILLDYSMDFGFSSVALHRAFRQGQASHLIVVRFIFRDTREHRLYLLNLRQPMVGLRTYDPATWKPNQEMKNNSII